MTVKDLMKAFNVDLNNLNEEGKHDWRSWESPVVIEVDGKEYNFEVTKGYRKFVLEIRDKYSL